MKNFQIFCVSSLTHSKYFHQILLNLEHMEIYATVHFSILEICEHFEKKVNLILVAMSEFWDILQFFWAMHIFWGKFLFYRGVISTFWTTIPFNFQIGVNFHKFRILPGPLCLAHRLPIVFI
jgi:hypothetical protein